jgi:hypothetical protein
MAELVPTKVTSHSFGSCKLCSVALTTGSASDTYTIEANAPVVDYWAQGMIGSAGYSPDVTWTASTGAFLITSAHQGAIKLFILMKT